MANGPTTKAAANAARLAADLSGRPIAYRRVPGNSRRYYDPKRPNETVSEHYVIRQYRPSLGVSERNYINSITQTRLRTSRAQLNSLADTWMAKQESLGRPVTSRNIAQKDAEFKELYQRLKVVSYEARHASFDSPERLALYASDGEYAQILVALGRRLPDDAFPVGESASQVGDGSSYINTVVLPALSAGNQSEE